jgi:hypothetical protein
MQSNTGVGAAANLVAVVQRNALLIENSDEHAICGWHLK